MPKKKANGSASVTVTVGMPELIECPDCRGYGARQAGENGWKVCKRCNGGGRVAVKKIVEEEHADQGSDGSSGAVP